MSNSTKMWYALATKIGSEKKVANLLSRKSIENFCPLKRQWIGKKKVVFEPLFASFIFVHMDESDMQSIRIVDGVVNFVYWLGRPAIISNEEVEIMRRFINEYSNVTIEKIPFGLDGTRRVVAGQLADNRAHLISVKNNTVKIVLPSLGYNMLAEAVNTDAEVIVSAKQSYNLVEKYKYAI